MRFDYWPISVIPEPMSITRLGFGLIVADPRSGEIETFFHDSSHMTRLFPTLKFLTESTKDLEKSLQLFRGNSAPSLPLTHELTLDGFMSQLHADWNNAIRIGSKRSMDAENLESAVALLSSKLLGAAPSKQRRTTVHDLRRQLVTAYQEFPNLRKATFPNVEAHVGRWDIDLTSAVVENENVYEINQSFNFDSSNAADANSRANFWAMKIERLRESGGELEHGKDIISVNKTTPVVALVLPPSTEREQEEYSKTIKTFDAIGIAVKSKQTIEAHAAQLDSKIA